MTLAWYAAYGSNTDAARFGEYLARCRGRVVPRDDRPLVIDLPLYFARAGTDRWGAGGVAFVGPGRERPASTLARGRLLAVEAIAEIGAMENGRPVAEAALDLERVVTDGAHVAFSGGWYDSWMACGVIDGAPVVTVTSSIPHAPNPPGRRYVEVVARGLRATHGLDDDAVAAYLAPRTGLTLDALLAWTRQGAGYSGAND